MESALRKEDQEKLEHCPFHEKPVKSLPRIQPVITVNSPTQDTQGYRVVCDWCGIHTSMHTTKEGAIHAWNCRPIEGALRRRMREAIEIVNRLNKHLQQE